MKNSKWFVAIIFAFIAGYFSHTNTEKNIESQTRVSLTAKRSDNLASQPISNVAPTATTNVLAKNKTNNLSQVENLKPQTPSTIPPLKPESVIVNESSGRNEQPLSKEEATAKYPKDMTDEEIDKVIPHPFSVALKNSHGGNREKYKNFVAANQPQDWDTNTQNKISDSILSSPYFKFLKLDALQCKANICEIRLYELKSNVWSLILAEMALQEWWEIGNYDSWGFGTELDSKQVTGYYVLLTRR